MELEFPRPKRKRESPSKDVPLVYGQKMQYANTDETRPLSDKEVADVKRITKRFHYYANAVDAAMLHTKRKEDERATARRETKQSLKLLS